MSVLLIRAMYFFHRKLIITNMSKRVYRKVKWKDVKDMEVGREISESLQFPTEGMQQQRSTVFILDTCNAKQMKLSPEGTLPSLPGLSPNPACCCTRQK